MNVIAHVAVSPCPARGSPYSAMSYIVFVTRRRNISRPEYALLLLLYHEPLVGGKTHTVPSEKHLSGMLYTYIDSSRYRMDIASFGLPA
jgi:hypothetical protein